MASNPVSLSINHRKPEDFGAWMKHALCFCWIKTQVEACLVFLIEDLSPGLTRDNQS
jgi:hypothetical protein